MMEKVCEVAIAAGKAIMVVYNDRDDSKVVDYKDDNSPLTLADKASHHVIVDALTAAYPSIPILSEEGTTSDYAERFSWDKYWLIDPLDGTKEFINRNGEFTVNIALIEDKRPVLGVVYVPAKEVLYYGDADGAVKIEQSESRNIQVNNKDQNRIAVRSKSHASPEEDVLYKNYDVDSFISVGSSLKFCMVAEGKADLYYRHGPTMEWDTGAGQAVLEAAGGIVYHGSKPEVPFRYNKKELLNGSFLCLGF
jgi:3'(2'), 5'-bisphosphate nucleotidase